MKDFCKKTLLMATFFSLSIYVHAHAAPKAISENDHNESIDSKGNYLEYSSVPGYAGMTVEYTGGGHVIDDGLFTNGEVVIDNTTYGDGGTASIYYSSGQLNWSVKPKYVGPYVYDLLITIVNERTGVIAKTIPLYGVDIWTSNGEGC